ncbi:MAG: CvpA family protein, partial [Bacilli bacterium]|nr:CvpA family protein [Bacilli bacterium]
MKKGYVIAGILEIIFVGLIYYFFLPAINPTSIGFWAFVVVALAGFALFFGIADATKEVVFVK